MSLLEWSVCVELGDECGGMSAVLWRGIGGRAGRWWSSAHREAERRREGRLSPRPRPAGCVSGGPEAGPGTGESDKQITERQS